MIEQGMTTMQYLHYTTTGHPWWGILGGGLILAFIAAHFLLFIFAVFSVLGSPQSAGMKLVWFVVVLFAPFIGSLAWFFIGRPNARRNPYYRNGY